MPLGSGALAGSGFPFDREAMARDLGFAAITRNSMDVSGDRDFALDFLYAASVTMLHLSRLAEDWILYSSEEFGWLELGDGVTSGSSLMPQKKNPDSLELIRGKCGRVFGDFTSLFVTMKGLPMTYNRDMQEDKEPLFDAARSACAARSKWRAWWSNRRSLHPADPAAAAEESWVVATDLAEALARAGTPFHQAHQIGGQAGAGKRAAGQEAGGLDRRGARRLSRPSSRRTWRGCCDPTRRDEDARDSGRHRAGGGRQGAGGGRSAAAHMRSDEQELPPGPDPEADSRASGSARRRNWRASCKKLRHSRPRR